MARPIRILHVLHAFAPGGLENGIVNIINRSPGHLVHELCLLTRGGDFLNRLTRPIAYHEMHKRSGNDFGMILRLSSLFRKRKIDVVHTRNWSGFDGVMASCLNSAPAVIHGEHGRDIADPAGLKQRRNIARRALSFRTRKFVGVSKDLCDWLESTVRIPSEKIVFIPNGVNTERFHPGRDVELRRELGIADEEFVVGTIGRLDPIKNHLGLINSIRTLQMAGRKVRLVIAGDGPERARLEQACAACPDPAPLILGYRSDTDRLYRAFDAFALNSFAEGMSNTVLEAMAAGLPTICSAVGGSLEILANDRGTLVGSGKDDELSAAVLRYAESPELRRAHGSEARRYTLENFSLDRMVRRYVDLYESVA